MKRLLIFLLFPLSLQAEEKSLKEALEEELTVNQDELAADVQELVELQTQMPVIQKLEEVESSMIKATLKLLENNTSQETLTIQTDIIEKAYEAAKEKSKGQGEGESETNKAMMDMLKKMLGKQDSSPNQKPGKAGEKAGEGDPGQGQEGEASEEIEVIPQRGNQRTVPAASAYSGQLLPEEFRELLEPYNDGEKEGASPISQ